MSAGLVRVVAPSVLIVVEREGVTRVLSTADTPAGDEALAEWIALSPERELLVCLALRDRRRTGGVAGQEAWGAALKADALRPFGDDADEGVARLLRSVGAA